MSAVDRPWRCADCGALAICNGRGPIPVRCPGCTKARKTQLARERRQAKGQARTAAGGDPFSVASVRFSPGPSAVQEVLSEVPRSVEGTRVQGNAWSRRGKIPLDLTGMPADLAEARIWLMARVFRVELYSWQKRVIRSIGGRTRPRRAYVQLARKNGKSLLAAAMVLTELVLCEESAVYAVSDSERNLTSVLMRELRQLIGRSAEADRAFIVTASAIEYPHTGSFLQLRPSNFSATQGINPTLVIFDEVHLQKTDEVWNGMRMAGAAASRFMLLGITTPGYDVASFAHDMYLRARNGEEGLYSRIFEPEDAVCSSTDRLAWVQSNPRLEDDPDFLPMLMDDQASLPDHEFRRFRLGMWTTTATAWLPAGRWDAAGTGQKLTPADIEAGEPLWLGFDGSYSGDSTALYGWVRRAGMPHGFVAGCWENPGRSDWRVPRDEVEAAVRLWMGSTRRAVLLADPPYWGRELGEWTAAWGGRVLEFPTHVRSRMAPACTTFYAGVMEGAFTHDGDPRMARHVANCVVKPSPVGDYITKAQAHSPAKIDLAVAAVVGYSVASAAETVRPRVYVA